MFKQQLLAPGAGLFGFVLNLSLVSPPGLQRGDSRRGGTEDLQGGHTGPQLSSQEDWEERTGLFRLNLGGT